MIHTIPYSDFIESKMVAQSFEGIPDHDPISSDLFDFQAALTSWSLRIGRSAIFADTGLGKTHMQTEWAAHVAEHGRVLVLAPLAVADQTVKTARSRGIEAAYRREDKGDRITVTNYEMMTAFDPADFAGVVLDESSILKSFTGKTRNLLIERFAATPYRLACTATPAPNDHTELGNHSEFLGGLTRSEMLAEFFVHDGGSTQDWRLKGHAVEPFWRWVVTWGAVVSSPASLGFDGSRFVLPELKVIPHRIGVDHSKAHEDGMLFVDQARTLNDQRRVRRETMDERVARIAELADDGNPWLVWCEYNAEGDALESAIPDAVQVSGSDSLDEKRSKLLGFSDGTHRVLITKPSIAGFGMNWQHCCRMAFVGPSHSYEQTYQAIRRCWRFGQRNPVEVHIMEAETESMVVQNYMRKERDAEALVAETEALVGPTMRAAISATERRWNPYNPTKTMEIPAWLTY